MINEDHAESDALISKLWSSEEEIFDLWLEKFSTDINMDADGSVDFSNYIKDWEELARTDKKKANEARFLE